VGCCDDSHEHFCTINDRKLTVLQLLATQVRVCIIEVYNNHQGAINPTILVLGTEYLAKKALV
jgi:hypothetical protein